MGNQNLSVIYKEIKKAPRELQIISKLRCAEHRSLSNQKTFYPLALQKSSQEQCPESQNKFIKNLIQESTNRKVLIRLFLSLYPNVTTKPPTPTEHSYLLIHFLFSPSDININKICTVEKHLQETFNHDLQHKGLVACFNVSKLLDQFLFH